MAWTLIHVYTVRIQNPCFYSADPESMFLQCGSRIHVFTGWIQNPHQNKIDPKHCFAYRLLILQGYLVITCLKLFYNFYIIATWCQQSLMFQLHISIFNNRATDSFHFDVDSDLGFALEKKSGSRSLIFLSLQIFNQKNIPVFLLIFFAYFSGSGSRKPKCCGS